MRKLASILLLLSFTLPFAGSYCWLQYKKHTIKEDIKCKMIARLDMHELVLLKFSCESAKKLNWEHNKEFEYHGEMYDVVSTEIQGDSVYYRCWRDHEETKLNKQLQKLVLTALGTNSENLKHQKGFTNFLKSLYQSPIVSWQMQPLNYDSFLFGFNIFRYNSPVFWPTNPPPELS